MSGKTLHLHAGFHKTGTSSIQNYFYTDFSHPDFHYLEAGVANSSLLLLKAFKQDLSSLPNFKSREITRRNVEKTQTKFRAILSKKIASTDKSNVIISAESIALFAPAEIEDMLRFMQLKFDKINVYFYVRPLKSRIESAFQEKLKTRFSSLDDKYVFDFRRSVGVFDSVLGASNVHLRKYSREVLSNQCVVTDFLSWLGIDAEIGALHRANSSLSLPAVKLLYIYRKHFPAQSKFDARIVKELSQLGGAKFHFHSSLYESQLITRAGSSEWFAQRAKFSLDVDIYAHDNNCVAGEEDLLDVSPEALAWLGEKTSTLWGSSRLRPGVETERAIAQAVLVLGKKWLR